jgi:putative endonuclease
MKLHHNYSVYILECSDGSYYTGVTNDLERRLWEHETGFDIKCYTHSKRPLILKYYESTNDVKQAILREKQIKGWSRKKKEAIFKENWEELRRLSKSYAIRRANGESI